MATFDISPLFRAGSAVGERPWSTWQTSFSLDHSGFPSYNILKVDEDAYCISLAVPGYDQQSINVETRDGALWIKGEPGPDKAHNQYLFHGVAVQPFQRTFQLPEHVKVAGARLEMGMLHIDLVREVPEEMRPRRVEIQTDAASQAVLEDQSETTSAAA